ncbi:hypothetical protein BH20VER1_BH20VER1_04100 [soil metagenome]
MRKDAAEPELSDEQALQTEWKKGARLRRSQEEIAAIKKRLDAGNARGCS